MNCSESLMEKLSASPGIWLAAPSFSHLSGTHWWDAEELSFIFHVILITSMSTPGVLQPVSCAARIPAGRISTVSTS